MQQTQYPQHVPWPRWQLWYLITLVAACLVGTGYSLQLSYLPNGRTLQPLWFVGVFFVSGCAAWKNRSSRFQRVAVTNDRIILSAPGSDTRRVLLTEVEVWGPAYPPGLDKSQRTTGRRIGVALLTRGGTLIEVKDGLFDHRTRDLRRVLLHKATFHEDPASLVTEPITRSTAKRRSWSLFSLIIGAALVVVPLDRLLNTTHFNEQPIGVELVSRPSLRFEDGQLRLAKFSALNTALEYSFFRGDEGATVNLELLESLTAGDVVRIVPRRSPDGRAMSNYDGVVLLDAAYFDSEVLIRSAPSAMDVVGRWTYILLALGAGLLIVGAFLRLRG